MVLASSPACVVESAGSPPAGQGARMADTKLQTGGPPGRAAGGRPAAISPVRRWRAGIMVLASSPACVVEWAGRPSEVQGTRMADTKLQTGARPAVADEDGLAAIELVGVEKEFTGGGHDVRAVEHVDLRIA